MIRRGSPAVLGAVLLAACARPVEVAPARALPPVVARAAAVSAVPAVPAPRPMSSPAELQARVELREAAARNTASGTALYQEALGARADQERPARLQRALNAYGLAARDWTRLFGLDSDAADGPEIRYWIADAWHHVVVIEEAVGGTPSPEELGAADKAAVAARATSTGAYREAAAEMVVGVADLALKLQHRLHARTHGAAGLEEREIRVTGEGDAVRAVTDPLPREVEGAIAARDAYLQYVAPGADAGSKRPRLALQAAELQFAYGHLAEARRRLRPLYDPTRCGSSEVGYRVWSRLLDIASLEHDVEAVRALAEDRMRVDCEPPRAHPPLTGTPTPTGDAYRLFERAQRSAPGPQQDALWRKAAAAYAVALRAAPDHDEAPEDAINGAYAYKQVGAYTEALALYRLLLAGYGSEASLARLAAGDPHATPPRPPDPRRYGERRGYAQMAAEQLAATEVLLLDYPAAAGEYDALAANARFEVSARRAAAEKAVVLHARLGESERAHAARDVFARLDPPPGALAELDWRVIGTSLGAWDERAPDTGSNHAARLAALTEVERFVRRHEARPDAARLVVHAAHAAARLRRAGGDRDAAAWCARAVRAEERSHAAALQHDGARSPEAELAASCVLAEIDAAAGAELGPARAPRRYRGDPAAIERALLADLARVDARARRVEELGRRLGPGPWWVDARATEAQLLAACRRGLAPLATDDRLRRALRVIEEKEARALVEVVLLAGALHVAVPEVVDARRRLAALVRQLGEPAMVALSAGIVDPVSQAPLVYREGMFASPPGMTVAAASGDALAPPLPVVE